MFRTFSFTFKSYTDSGKPFTHKHYESTNAPLMTGNYLRQKFSDPDNNQLIDIQEITVPHIWKYVADYQPGSEDGENRYHEVIECVDTARNPEYVETPAEIAASYLRYEYARLAEGADWFETYSDNYTTGVRTEYSYHLEGFSRGEFENVVRMVENG